MFVSSSLCRGGRLVMGLLVFAAALLVVSEGTTVGYTRKSMEVSSHGGEVVQRTFGGDPCGGICEGLGRSCVVATKGRAFCVDCSGLLRRTGSGTKKFAECCHYNAKRKRCGQALRRTPAGKCLRSEVLFVRAPVPTPASFKRSSGNACGKPWDFRNNGLACRLTKPRNGKRRCINADGKDELPSQCSTSFVQVGENIRGEVQWDLSGRSVAMSADGTRVAIGAPGNAGSDFGSGHVRVFELQGSKGWVQLGEDIDGESEFDESGISVAMSADGNRMAIGAAKNRGNGRCSGHVRVFELDESKEWIQVGEDIDSAGAFNESGRAVAMSADGSRVAIGSPNNSDVGIWSGHVRVFQLQGSRGWVQKGEAIDGESRGDQSGLSLAISADGTRLAIGSPNNKDNGDGSGHVRVFELRGSRGWVQIGADIDGESEFDESGVSVAISADGSRVAVGAPYNNGSGRNSGHVRVFDLHGSEGWVQMGEDIDGESRGDKSGTSVAISADGSRVAIGAISNGGNGRNSGHVRVFELQESEGWVQVGEDIDGEAARNGAGESVAMSADGSRVAIGSLGGSDNYGHVQVFKAIKQCN